MSPRYSKTRKFALAALLVLLLAAMAGVINSDLLDFDAYFRSRAPAVDRDQFALPIDEVLFNTFKRRQGMKSMAQLSDDAITALRDKIKPIYRPRYLPADAKHFVRDDDLVIGYVDGEQAWAFPTRILSAHEIINETLAQRPVLISWCPVTHSAGVYDRRLGDRILTFGNTSAVIDSNLVMYDHQTGSYWWQVAGRSVGGELISQPLKMLPSTATTWSAWREAHPNTQVLIPEADSTRAYHRTDWVKTVQQINLGKFRYPVTERAGPTATIEHIGAGNRPR
jgi:hypothetical protein